jgi:hypothetical protein
MPAPRDREPHILEQAMPAFPLPPLNVACQPGLDGEVYDIRWSEPAELQANSRFDLLGVNVYRSFDSEYGPYFRLNVVPVGATFWRDKTRVLIALQEDVSSAFTLRGADSDSQSRYVFRTRNRPIVITPSPGVDECTNLNVQVTVNGVPAYVESIHASTGEVELRKLPTFDVASQSQTPPVLPTSPSDVVLATYRYVTNRVRSDLDRHIFYRVTTVARDRDTGDLLETPLERATQSDNRSVERTSWVWNEAIRRNKYMLYQAGERSRLFIRRTSGPECGCYSSTHRQPQSDCLTCFGTGIIGGYEGPFDILLSPDDGSVNIQQSNRGRNKNHVYETWTGPSPVISQRDFIVKLDGDRYGIGPVRRPTSRGMRLQQFFSISSLDHADIRYKVPVFDGTTLVAPRTRLMVPGKGSSVPMVTDRPTIPAERQLRSGSPTGENEKY